MSSPRPSLSVIVPVYRNEATLPAVVDRFADLARELHAPVEVVFVVDGSPDASAVVLQRLLFEGGPFSSQLIVLSRNFGSFSAIRAGLAAAEGEIVAIQTADLQEPPHLLVDFYNALAGGEHDVALGVRTHRADPAGSRMAALLFWRMYHRFIQPEMPVRGIDVFACTRQVASELIRMQESHTSLVGLLLWTGFRRVEVPYDRVQRTEGRSGWSMRRRVRYLLDSVFSFTNLPVDIITMIGVVGVAGSVITSLVVLIAWLANAVEVAGYTPLMLAVALSSSAILLSLGIIGSYIWRTYENTKGRPPTIPMSHERFDARSATNSE
jgi:glycosyltransferase involved in cell wall biosynthesis